MKTILCLLGFVLLAQCATADPLAIPQTCEDILPQAQCDQLRAIAKLLGEKVTAVNDAVKAAAAKHIKNVKDTLAFVQEYLANLNKNFTCESVLSAATCQKLDDIGGLLKLTIADVNKAIAEVIAHGAKAGEIVKKARDYMRDFLSNLQCEDVLAPETCGNLKDFAKLAKVSASEVVKAVREAVIEGANGVNEIFKKAKDFLSGEITCESILGDKVCQQLYDAAKRLGEKKDQVTAAVRAAIEKHVTNAKEILKTVRETMVDLAKDFKCESVLSADMCAAIDKIGAHFKDSIDTVNKAIKEAIVNGATSVNEIYRKAIAWMKDNLVVTKCEDLLDAVACQQIRDFAKKVSVNVNEVMDAVKEAIGEGASNTREIIAKAIEYLKARISCEAVLGRFQCGIIRRIATAASVSLDKIDSFLREQIASGVTKVTAMVDALKRLIKSILSDQARTYVADDSIKDRILEKLGKAIDRVLDTLKVTSEKVRNKIKEIIFEGKVKISEIRQKIKDILAGLTADSKQDAQYQLGDLRDKLQALLAKATGKAKDFIKMVLQKNTERLEKMKAYILKMLDMLGIKDSQIDVLLDEVSSRVMTEMSDEMDFFTDAVLEESNANADLF